RNEDAARFGQRLQPGGYVDPTSIKVAALDQDITEIDTDSQYDVLAFRRIAISSSHGLLQLDGTLHGVNSARELDQYAITRDLEDAAPVLSDQRLKDFLTTRLERGQRACLVGLHQPAVANHIGG